MNLDLESVMDHSRDFNNNGSPLYADGQQQHAQSDQQRPIQQQYISYDNLGLFPGQNVQQASYDASWGLNASRQYTSVPASSRGTPVQHVAASAWPQNANHLSTTAIPPHVNHAQQQPSSHVRSLSHSPAPYGQHAFQGYAEPQAYQFHQQRPQYDPALISQKPYETNTAASSADYHTPGRTIAPHIIQAGDQPQSASTAFKNGSLPSKTAPPAPQRSRLTQADFMARVPKGVEAGLFTIMNFDDLSTATNSERFGNFVNIGLETVDLDCNRATLPNYVPRRSRNDLRKAAGDDLKALAKIGRASRKDKASSELSKQRPLNAASSAVVGKDEKIKYEGEAVDEDDSSSEDDGSSYTSDSEDDAPLPSKRPEGAKEAFEYDTIKALWRSKRKSITSDSLKRGILAFWETVKTIRDSWKAEVDNLKTAEDKKRTNALPLLKSRVTDQLDLMETVLKAALKHGHREIVKLLGENTALLFVCYQLLLDRAKVEDYNGPLSRVVLELMTLFTTLTDEKLEKTHLSKVLPRFTKKADAKTQFYAKRILSNAVAASKGPPTDAPAKKTPAATAGTPAGSPAGKRAAPEPVAGVKRAATSIGEGGALKKVATGAAKAGTTTTTTTAKVDGITKTTASADVAKAALGTTVKAKPVAAKPSSLFASLSAAKKPGTSTLGKQGTALASSKPVAEKASVAPATVSKSTFSFAETMANLSKPKEEKPANVKPVEKEIPIETAEEKSKRLRKESRRHLHVHFKRDGELVQIREFHHDPDEELGHDASQVRDVGDVGGEGRMFKQQQHMRDLESEEEEAVEEESRLLEFSLPSHIDFSVVDAEERKRNFAPFGGGQNPPESPERTAREQYEANTLIVFYANADDVPPNPREPSIPYSGPVVDEVRKFGAPEEKYRHRVAATIRASGFSGTSPQLHPGLDLSKLSAFGSTAPRDYPPIPAPVGAPQISQQQPQMSAANDALSNILASLKQATPGVFSAAAAAAPPQPPPLPPQQQQQGPPPGQPDLAAILAQLTQQQPAAPAAPPTMSMGNNYSGFTFPPSTSSMSAGGLSGGIYENAERKSWRENGNSAGTPGDGAADRGMIANANAIANAPPPPGAHPNYRTKVCKYWQEGRCQKGEGCSYKHEE